MPNTKIDSMPRTIGELARYYNVDRKTMKRWLCCETLRGIVPDGNYFSINQVRMIVDHLGRNEDI